MNVGRGGQTESKVKLATFSAFIRGHPRTNLGRTNVLEQAIAETQRRAYEKDLHPGSALIDASAGSDHAWGGHAFVVGGGVQGGDIFGRMPDLTLGGPDDVDDGNARGRFIPTLAVDQYAATLAKWFGVSDSALDTVFPNLRRFATRDVGFMKAG